MGKNEKTGPAAAREAGRLLRKKTTSKPIKKVAASDLTQAPDKKKKRKK